MSRKKLSDKEIKQRKHLKIFGIVTRIVCTAMIVVLLMVQGGLAGKIIPAISIDGKDYKLCVFNYYYYAYYNAYLEDNQQYIDYMFDTSKSLKSQNYDENQTWFTYFEDKAVESMTGVLRTASLARSEGYQMSDEEQKAEDNQISEIEDAASRLDETTDSYLENIYGEGMTEALYKEQLTATDLSASYSKTIKEGFTFSEDQLKQEFDENR